MPWRFHVLVPVLDHASPLGAVRVEQRVAHDEETVRLQGLENGSIELALLRLRRDMVERQRSDDRVTTRKRVRKPSEAQLDATFVCRAARGNRVEHVRIDVDESDAHVRQPIENRR